MHLDIFEHKIAYKTQERLVQLWLKDSDAQRHTSPHILVHTFANDERLINLAWRCTERLGTGLLQV